jgi:hypothetical protein
MKNHEIKEMLSEFGTVDSLPLTTPGEKPRVVVGILSHQASLKSSQAMDDEAKMKHIRIESDIREASKRLADIGDGHSTHLILENRRRNSSDWSDLNCNELLRAIHFEENVLPTLQSIDEVSQYFRYIKSQILESEKYAATDPKKAAEYKRGGEALLYNIFGEYRQGGEYLQSGREQLLHGHDNISALFMQRMREFAHMKEKLMQTKPYSKSEEAKAVAFYRNNIAEYFRCSHGSIATVIQEDLPENANVVVYQGREHFLAGAYSSHNPQCEGTHLEHFLGQLPNTYTIILDPRSIKSS